MSSIQPAVCGARPRGSAQLLQARGGAAQPEPQSGAADAQLWLQRLRREGGKPCPPRLALDGAAFTDLLRGDLLAGGVRA